MNRLWKFSVVMICAMLWMPVMAEAQVLEWDSVSAADIKEYSVYSCQDQEFPDTDIECLESIAVVPHPVTTYDISDIANQAWFRVTAIDTSGNESEFSHVVDNRSPSAPLGVRIKIQVTVTITP